MEIEKILSEFNEGAFNLDIKDSLSYESKRFLVELRDNFRKEDLEFTTIAILTQLIDFAKNEDSKKSWHSNFITNDKNSNDSNVQANGEKLGNLIAEIFGGWLRKVAYFNQQKSTKVLKRNYYLSLYEEIEFTLIQMGYTFQKTEKLKKLALQLRQLIVQNTVTGKKLQPKEGITIEIMMDMLTILANRAIISIEFIKPEIQLKWINKAIDFMHGYDASPHDALLIIDWKSHVHLADWLLFLKENYIDYSHSDNKQLLEWVRMNHSYNGEPYLADQTQYASLKRNLRNRKKFISDYMYVQNGRFCLHKNYR
jgi:hypothetical protein